MSKRKAVTIPQAEYDRLLAIEREADEREAEDVASQEFEDKALVAAIRNPLTRRILIDNANASYVQAKKFLSIGKGTKLTFDADDWNVRMK